MNQLESTQRNVKGMIKVAENILCGERQTEEEEQTNKTATTNQNIPQKTKTMHKSCFQMLKINCKVKGWFYIHCG